MLESILNISNTNLMQPFNDMRHTIFQYISSLSFYGSDETGAYDSTIFTATADLFAQMQERVQTGEYRTYDFEGSDIQEAANKVWAQVRVEKLTGKLRRAFTTDYESTVPSGYTKDGKSHCYLYIEVKIVLTANRFYTV